MKSLFIVALAGICFSFSIVENQPVKSRATSPLSNFSKDWDQAKYIVCNTADSVDYMSAEEKKVIWILNMARMNPKLFCNTVVKKYPAFAKKDNFLKNPYFKSLVTKMTSLEALNLLYPDKKSFESAQCHSVNSGNDGYVGHTRSKKDCADKKYYNGECCDYGHDAAIDIVMALLIDDNVESLGHRNICFTNYKTLAVSIQPHKVWRFNSVLDFHY